MLRSINTTDNYKRRYSHPFGSSMPGYSYKVDSADGYRFGFNGQEHEIDGLGDYYSFEYRIHDARIGRFLTVDPLSFSYPWNSAYAFAENMPLDGVDIEGLEHYYTADGKKLTENEVKSREVNGLDISNLTFDEKSEDVYEILDFKLPLFPSGTEISAIKKLDVTHNDLLSWAGWVNNETYSLSRGGSMAEKWALASTINNWAKNDGMSVSKKLTNKLDKKDFINKNGKHFRENYKLALEKVAEADRSTAIAGVMNAVTNGVDFSHGATQWDGIEQGHYDGSTCIQPNGWHNHAAEMGWTISSDHFETWKTSITKWHGNDYFKAPQHAVALGCPGYEGNEGLMRMKSSACFGTTIFWKIRTIDNSKTEHNEENDNK